MTECVDAIAENAAERMTNNENENENEGARARTNDGQTTRKTIIPKTPDRLHTSFSPLTPNTQLPSCDSGRDAGEKERRKRMGPDGHDGGLELVYLLCAMNIGFD